MSPSDFPSVVGPYARRHMQDGGALGAPPMPPPGMPPPVGPPPGMPPGPPPGMGAPPGPPPGMGGPPQGALGQAAGQGPGGGGRTLIDDVQLVKAGLQTVLGRLRQMPGVNMQAFNQGVAMIEHGLAMVGAAMKSVAPPQ